MGSEIELLYAALGAVVVGVIGFGLGYVIAAIRKEAEKEEAIESARADTAKRQRSTVGGQIAETLRPYIGEFPYDPSELTFIGDPVDFVAFKGKSSGQIQEIVFIEVKRGAGSLRPSQRQTREAVEAGRVRWFETRFPEPGR